ncbi:phage terminase large subunit [uncultured Mediterranean phage uvMED]|jgi:phage terminase large subunit|nr:phage terminase large subunit [uncultured Mediterranean phage uvMED]BAR16280.1 phage terminase large subunit [uncultured Mediterranean phage uvMED]
MHIEIPYTPRPLQAMLHNELDKHRFAVLNCHRRFGKSILIIMHLIKKALTNEKKNPRYYLIGPTFVSIKRVCWDYLKQYAGCIPGTTFNETELRCDLPNGARITLLSSEDPDKIRGIYADGVCIDECSQMNPVLWNEILRPALSDRKGFAYFISTPQGMSNIFYDLYQHALGDPQWLAYTAKASQTNIIDQEELDAAKAQMGDTKYKQEFECDWIANIEGSIYGDIIKKLEEDKQITRVSYDPALEVHTAWDLGVDDQTVIIFFQLLGNQILIIDYYENNREGLPHYVQVVKNKDYVYGEHYAPWDLEITEFSSGKTRKEVAYQLGIRFRVLPKLNLEEGIHSLKMLLPKCWFDADQAKPLVDALRQYHRKYNEKMKMFGTKPVRDWSSHACDAARYMAMSITDLPRKKIAAQQTAVNDYTIHGD